MTEIQNSLRELAETIFGMVADAKSKGTIQSEEEAFWHSRVTDFEYTDRGITQARTEGTYVAKKTWFRASIALEKGIWEQAVFISALGDLEQTFPALSGLREHLEKFARTILHVCLYNDTNEDIRTEADSTIGRFLGELSGGPVTYKAKVEVLGVVLRSRNISLDPGTAIRQPIKEDLEKTVRPIGFIHPPFTYPSAILEVELRSGRGQNALLQSKVEQCVALLRLFDVGSVKWISYDISSDSLLDIMGQGTVGSGERAGALETYAIKSEAESNLRQFWQTLNVLLPKDIYDFHKQISHVTLAYDRYSDGLLHNGVVERRIANAVMGLEALFLEETQELSYRLGLRASKILSLVGRNPLEVRECIKDAYAIRSAFAHGGHLDYKAKKRLERKYGDAKKLLRSILDYLRLSIINHDSLPCFKRGTGGPN